jgi:hypothetical protein
MSDHSGFHGIAAKREHSLGAICSRSEIAGVSPNRHSIVDAFHPGDVDVNRLTIIGSVAAVAQGKGDCGGF